MRRAILTTYQMKKGFWTLIGDFQMPKGFTKELKFSYLSWLIFLGRQITPIFVYKTKLKTPFFRTKIQINFDEIGLTKIYGLKIEKNLNRIPDFKSFRHLIKYKLLEAMVSVKNTDQFNLKPEARILRYK